MSASLAAAGQTSHVRDHHVTAHHVLHHHSHLLLSIVSLARPSANLLTLTCAIGHLILNPPHTHLVHVLRITWSNHLVFHTPAPADLVAECRLLNTQYPQVAQVVSPLALHMLATLPRVPSLGQSPTSLVYQSASNAQGYACGAIPAEPHVPPVISVAYLQSYLYSPTVGPFRSRAHILSARVDHARGTPQELPSWGPRTDYARAHARSWHFVPDAFLLVSYYLRLGDAAGVRCALTHLLRIDPMVAHVRVPVSVWVQGSLDLRMDYWLRVHALVVRAGNPQVRLGDWLVFVAASDAAVHVMHAVYGALAVHDSKARQGQRHAAVEWPLVLVSAFVGRLHNLSAMAKRDPGVGERVQQTLWWLQAHGLNIGLGGLARQE